MTVLLHGRKTKGGNHVAGGASPEQLLYARLHRGSQKGQLLMDVAKVKHAWQYEYQLGTDSENDDEIVWGEAIFTTTKSRTNVIEGLQSVKRYWVRAMNGHGTGDWSEAASGVTD